jgi:hypothetical protein
MFIDLLSEAFGPLSLVRSRNCLDHLRLDQQHKELPLKRASLATALVASLAFMHTAAHAEGCTKGAVVGGVGGHVAGGHGVAGAAAGCAIGHHEEGQGRKRCGCRKSACGKIKRPDVKKTRLDPAIATGSFCKRVRLYPAALTFSASFAS